MGLEVRALHFVVNGWEQRWLECLKLHIPLLRHQANPAAIPHSHGQVLLLLSSRAL